MACHGYNMPLAFVGQEAVWRDLYLGVGVTEEELQKYFTGPAFLAWQRMGNIRFGKVSHSKNGPSIFMCCQRVGWTLVESVD